MVSIPSRQSCPPLPSVLVALCASLALGSVVPAWGRDHAPGDARLQTRRSQSATSPAGNVPVGAREADESTGRLRPSLAIEGGYYHISFRGFDDHAASVAPMLNLSTDRLSVTLKYLYTRYTLGSSDINKHDLDTSLTLFPHRLIGFFVGFRAEIQEVRVSDLSGKDSGFGFNVYAVPVGTTASIEIPRTGIYLFGVGTIFAYTLVNQKTPRADEDGFGGYALAAGMAYPLDVVLGVPLSLKAGYRFQNLEVGDFDEEVDQVNVGVAWHF